MEELLKDFVDNFSDMDTSDLDLSDDLLDLSEDDLLNLDIDLFTSSEYEDLEELSEDMIIDSFFVHDDDQLNDKKLKSILTSLNCMSSPKSNLINSNSITSNSLSTTISLNSSLNSPINSRFLINSNLLAINNPPSQPTQSNLVNGALQSNHASSNFSSSSSSNYSSVHASNYSSNCTSNIYVSNIRSQPQCFKENSLTDDSYSGSSDDDFELIAEHEYSTSQMSMKDVSINCFKSDLENQRSCDRRPADKRSSGADKNASKIAKTELVVSARDQSKNRFRNQCTNRNQNKFKSAEQNHQQTTEIPRRKLSSSRGTSLLAKPKSLKKIAKDLGQLDDAFDQSNYEKFITYFYQDHNYCSYRK